jgi:hypothetical protein
MHAVATLYHPHITELYEFEVSEGRAFIIGELPPMGFYAMRSSATRSRCA